MRRRPRLSSSSDYCREALPACTKKGGVKDQCLDSGCWTGDLWNKQLWTWTDGKDRRAGNGRIPDESVDLCGLDIPKLLYGVLDLALVCLDVDKEYEGVVLLDLFHGGLGVEWPERKS